MLLLGGTFEQPWFGMRPFFTQSEHDSAHGSLVSGHDSTIVWQAVIGMGFEVIEPWLVPAGKVFGKALVDFASII